MGMTIVYFILSHSFIPNVKCHMHNIHVKCLFVHKCKQRGVAIGA